MNNEWIDDAANTPFPERFRQVGPGIAVDQACMLTIVIDERLAFRVHPGERATATIASSADQIVLDSQEPDEAAVLDVMRRCHGQLCVGQALCENGLFEIYRTVCQLRGVGASRSNAAQVVLAASRAESPECGRAVAMFCGLLGDAAGRAALTLGSTGGVFLEGPIVGQLGDTFARSPFRRRFEGAGRLADALRIIPTFINRVRLLDVATPATRQRDKQYRVR